MVTSSKDKAQEIYAPNEEMTYETLNSQYKINGRTQVLEQMISQLIWKIFSSSRAQNYSIQKELNEIVNDLMLNELELALWVVYLEKIPFKALQKFDKELLIFSAFKAKMELADNIESYFSFIDQKMPEFKNKYLRWVLANKKNLEYTPNEINDKFNELRNALYIDEGFPNHTNKICSKKKPLFIKGKKQKTFINYLEDASKEQLPTLNTRSLPCLSNNFNKNKPICLGSAISLKRHKVEKNIEENQIEEKSYFELGGQIFVLEATELRQTSFIAEDEKKK